MVTSKKVGNVSYFAEDCQKIGKAKASKWTLAITAIFPNGHLNAQPRTFEEKC